jgi:hypothetical protein
MEKISRREMLKGTAGLIVVPSLISQVKANQDRRICRTDALDYIRSISQKIAPILENLHSKYGYLNKFPVGKFSSSISSDSLIFETADKQVNAYFNFYSPSKSVSGQIEDPGLWKKGDFHLGIYREGTELRVFRGNPRISLRRGNEDQYPNFRYEFNFEDLKNITAVLGPRNPNYWERDEILEHPLVGYHSESHWKKGSNLRHALMDSCPDSLVSQTHLLGTEIPWKIDFNAKVIEIVDRSGLPEFADALEERFG